MRSLIHRAAISVLGFLAVVAQAQPIAPPATPTTPAGQVLSLYNSSGVYTDVSGINYFENWGGWASAGNYSIPPTVLSYQSVQYGGIDVGVTTPINVAAYTHVHLDLYTPNGSSFALRMVDNVGAHHEADFTYTTAGGVIVSNTWLHLDIPLSAFTTANPSLSLASIFQLGLINNKPGQTGSPDYYIDNLYFYSPAIPLAVSITSPAASATVSPSFSISATATVSPGTITNVNFYDGATLLGNDTTAPYSYSVTGAALGAHTLKAIARDSSGNSATSSVISITVSNLPSNAAYEPFNYSTLANGTAATGTGFTGNWTIGGTVTLDTGLTYPSLPTSNNSFRQAPGNRSQVSFANPLSSGAVYVSFLFNQLGDNGANFNGVYFPGSGSSSLFCGFGVFGGFSAGAGSFGLGSVTTAGGASTGTGFVRKTGVNYSSAHLAVLKIDFNTSGANDTVSLWIDPVAGTNAPATAADVTYSSFDVGTISGMGLNFPGGGFADIADEFRVGTSYADVVGSSAGATIPTTLSLSIAAGNQVSWIASSTNFYQPQSSPDNSTWSDLGGLLNGSAVTSAYDPAPAAFYQVLEIAPVLTEAAVNGGFETDDGGTGALNWNGVQTQPPIRITTDFHTDSACMDLSVTNVVAGANGSELQQNLVSQGSSVIGGNTYTLTFWAKQISTGPGYVQNYKIAWLNGATIVGAVGFNPFAGGNGTWSQISTGPIVAPATADGALIQIVAATGADPNMHGEVLVDDVSLTTTTATGPANVIPSTVQSGAVFTATVLTNGVTATAASGTVAFKTNTVAQSTGTVAGGAANSTPTAVPAAYTLTAIYSGDGTYRSSTNTLVVGSSVNTSPTNLLSSISGNQLTLSWPADHIGWSLLTQTNSRAAGLGTNWFVVGGSTTTNQMTFTVNPANPTVFFRMVYP